MYMSLCTAEHVAACAKVPACYQTGLAGAPPAGMMPAGGVTTGSLLSSKPIVNDWRRQEPSQLVPHIHTDSPNYTHEAVRARLLFISSPVFVCGGGIAYAVPPQGVPVVKSVWAFSFF